MIISEQYKFLYCCPERTASRSLADFFSNYGGIVNVIKHYPILPEEFDSEGYKVLLSIRDPFTRLCSFGQMVIESYPQLFGYGVEWSTIPEWIQYAIQEADTFIEWKHWPRTKRNQLGLPVSQRKYYDQVLQINQTVKLIRFENLQEDVESLSFVTLPVDIPHIGDSNTDWEQYRTPELTALTNAWDSIQEVL